MHGNTLFFCNFINNNVSSGLYRLPYSNLRPHIWKQVHIFACWPIAALAFTSFGAIMPYRGRDPTFDTIVTMVSWVDLYSCMVPKAGVCRRRRREVNTMYVMKVNEMVKWIWLLLTFCKHIPPPPQIWLNIIWFYHPSIILELKN